MIISKDTLERIKQLIELKYTGLLLKLLNPEVLSSQQKKDLLDSNVSLSNYYDIIRYLYTYNFNYDIDDPTKPNSFKEIIVDAISNRTPNGDVHTSAISYLEQSLNTAIEKLKQVVINNISSIFLEANEEYRRGILQDLDRSETLESVFKEKFINQITKKLRETSKEVNRDWQRVVVTELTNLIGIAHTDKIIMDNADTDLDTVFVYRKPMSDACRWCKEFYLTSSDTPKLYPITELIGNGSNYGKKNSEWLPVVGATHPWSRTSPPIQLKPGFKVNLDGTQSFMGLKDWLDYVKNNL